MLNKNMIKTERFLNLFQLILINAPMTFSVIYKAGEPNRCELIAGGMRVTLGDDIGEYVFVHHDGTCIVIRGGDKAAKYFHEHSTHTA